MRIPDCLATLHDQGIIGEVLRPLMSGKEAQIYLVTTGDQLCVAKVYKEANNRSFKHRAAYTEGRKVRNSRDQRAMAKRSKHGKEQEEAAWRSTEVDVIYRLHAGGVRVPVPHHFIDGVLVMELIADADGNPAPRLGDVVFEPEVATRIYQRLINEVMRMLCAGIVHGDLSDFNVLLGADGPVIIDFPQSVDTAHNSNARQLLLRDVDNIHRFLARFVPQAPRLPYAEEMWDLHQKNALTPDTQLTGRYRASGRQVNVSNVLGLIDDANRDERKRRDALGLRGGPPQRPEAFDRTEPATVRGQSPRVPVETRRALPSQTSRSRGAETPPERSNHHSPQAQRPDHHSPQAQHSGHRSPQAQRPGHHSPQAQHSGHHSPQAQRPGHHSPQAQHSGHHSPQAQHSGHHSPQAQHSGHHSPQAQHSGHHSPQAQHSGHHFAQKTPANRDEQRGRSAPSDSGSNGSTRRAQDRNGPKDVEVIVLRRPSR